MGSWSLTGNALGTPPFGSLGTTDDNPLVIFTNGAERVRVDTSGNVGIGTATPSAPLEVNGGVAHMQTVKITSSGNDAALSLNNTEVGGREYWIDSGAGGAGVGAGNFAVWDQTARAPRLVISQSGNVGIGTTAPSSALHVAGDITVTGDVLLSGADCAEHFDVAGEPPEPGTVVVIDPEGALRESQEPYDKKVAGVVSGAGEYRHAIVLDNRSSEKPRASVALLGKVYCKVDADYSPIRVGDLLTTSPTPGHAMRATEPLRAFGSVIGKALRPLDGGHGLIPILIALQ